MDHRSSAGARDDDHEQAVRSVHVAERYVRVHVQSIRRTFECSLDGAGFTACTSPVTYERLSGGDHAFEVRAVKGGALDKSPARFTWTVELASSSSGIPTWVWILIAILVAALIAAGIYYLIARRRRAMRTAWQSAALAEPPPDRCHGDGDYVWRRDHGLRPGLREIDSVVLRGTSAAGGEIRREVSPEVAGGLNRAVEAWRLRRGRETVHETLDPVAVQLLGEAEAWAEARNGGKVTVAARLTGGKVDREFKRFQCVAQGSYRVWKPTDTWRAVVDDEPEEVIGDIRVVSGAGWAEQSDGVAKALHEFVQQVDVPDVQQPPETSPA